MIRPAVVVDMYYPSNPQTLRETLQNAFREAPATTTNSRIVVAPYGSYRVALPYITSSLKSVGDTAPERVVILAPPHTAATNQILLPESTEFETPYGTLPVDTTTISSLAEHARGKDLLVYDEIAHLQNHSHELVLPVLHHLYGPIPIVPLLVGSLNRTGLLTATELISTHIDLERSLIIASGNLSGFVSPSEADARSRKVLRLLMSTVGQQIFEAIETFEDPPISLSSLSIAHALAGGELHPEVLGRGTFETDYEGAVGSVVFASIAYTPT